MAGDGFERGIELFNEGDFFGAHEAWEDVWRELEESPEKHFLQGMIMIAGALHHYLRKEYAGTSKLLEKGIQILNDHMKAKMNMDKEDFLKGITLFSERFRSSEENVSQVFPMIKKII